MSRRQFEKSVIASLSKGNEETRRVPEEWLERLREEIFFSKVAPTTSSISAILLIVTIVILRYLRIVVPGQVVWVVPMLLSASATMLLVNAILQQLHVSVRRSKSEDKGDTPA